MIGKSVDGRNLYAIKLGKGDKEIFINGSHHAREHMTSNLVMEMLDVYSYHYKTKEPYSGYDVYEVLNEVSIWFVPMVNPDGVTLVQKGYTSARNPSQVLKLNNGSTDFSAWKANIRGVDLNRQYPAKWESIRHDPGKPSPQNYKGPAPLSEPETKALVDFTLKHKFKTAVSYHSSGEIIFWHFHQSGAQKDRDFHIGKMLETKTGYRLVDPVSNPSGGGYTDWFISNQKNPAYTPELSPHVGPRPIPLENYDKIWTQNNTVGLMLAHEAKSR
ncbi:M14 family metallocarboxypeptidase [Bacillus salitolerans]|uniref:M14 family metallocarboxypeptidase n=1 Tax=Bacillus salitolerans TaxID=1437434 RepID=A0ABW4LNN6_9BACI